jgi:hypothetical protein
MEPRKNNKVKPHGAPGHKHYANLNTNDDPTHTSDTGNIPCRRICGKAMMFFYLPVELHRTLKLQS